MLLDWRSMMTQLAIRQSGGANIISIPKAILKTLDLKVGSMLNLSIEDSRIVLTPAIKEPTLDELLAGSPRENFRLTDEDREWLAEAPAGKELI